MRGTKIIDSCLPPNDWGDTISMFRASFSHNYPKELRANILARCRAYGLPDAGPVEQALGRVV